LQYIAKVLDFQRPEITRKLFFYNILVILTYVNIVIIWRFYN